MAAQPYGVPTIPHSFLPSENFLRVLSASLSRSLMKMLTNTGSIIDSWSTPLLMDLQLDFVHPITTLRAWQFRQFSIYLTVHLSVCQWGC